MKKEIWVEVIDKDLYVQVKKYIEHEDILKIEPGFLRKNAKITLKNGTILETINNYEAVNSIVTKGDIVSEKYFYDIGLDKDARDYLYNIRKEKERILNNMSITPVLWVVFTTLLFNIKLLQLGQH